ncbi:hypothetical protein BD408DRAFT_411212 [Parasitella parasitica]|nr:hypothetical protein BD408DRAFT_411212 [Parasitella parasitica]
MSQQPKQLNDDSAPPRYTSVEIADTSNVSSDEKVSRRCQVKKRHYVFVGLALIFFVLAIAFRSHSIDKPGIPSKLLLIIFIILGVFSLFIAFIPKCCAYTCGALLEVIAH